MSTLPIIRCSVGDEYDWISRIVIIRDIPHDATPRTLAQSIIKQYGHTNWIHHVAIPSRKKFLSSKRFCKKQAYMLVDQPEHAMPIIQAGVELIAHSKSNTADTLNQKHPTCLLSCNAFGPQLASIDNDKHDVILSFEAWSSLEYTTQIKNICAVLNAFDIETHLIENDGYYAQKEATCLVELKSKSTDFQHILFTLFSESFCKRGKFRSFCDL